MLFRPKETQQKKTDKLRTETAEKQTLTKLNPKNEINILPYAIEQN